ncbi:Basic secretory protein, partial [Quillaja saponaria]
ITHPLQYCNLFLMHSHMKEDQHSFFQPLISSSSSSSSSTATAATTTSYSIDSNYEKNTTDQDIKISTSNYGIIIRLLSVVSIAIISLWANYEASKGFEITLINDNKESLAGRRFNLFYISNDKATRIALNTSAFVENLLYPTDDHLQPKKHINKVTLRLAATWDLTPLVTAGGSIKDHHYVINISPSILEDVNFHDAIVFKVQRAMAKIWLWDGESNAPPSLIDGMVEYVCELAGFGNVKFSGSHVELPECEHVWWKDKNPKVVARFLHYCEGEKKGFIQRLNYALKDTWHDRIVDDVMGIPAQQLCGSYNSSSASQVSNLLYSF